MSERIQAIKKQIEAIESELVKLRYEQQQLQENVPDSIGSEPSEVSAAAKNMAVAQAGRLPQLRGIENAIALLERRSTSLQRELKEHQKEQSKADLRLKVNELEPQLLAVAHRINQASLEMDSACQGYHQLALEYNQVRSELENQPVYPVTMSLSGVPYVITRVGRGFNLRLGLKKTGEAITFEQVPPPYVPSPSYSTPIETRLELLKSSLSGLKNYRQTLPDSDLSRVVMLQQQIEETERQIRALEQQEGVKA